MSFSLSDTELLLLQSYILQYGKIQGLEIESRIGLPIYNFGGETNKNDLPAINRILSFLDNPLNRFSKLPKETTLDINFISDPKNKYDPLNVLRFTINSADAISYYCTNEKLPPHSIIYKSWIENNEEFKEKLKLNIPDIIDKINIERFTLDINEYSLRISGKLEQPFNQHEQRFDQFGDDELSLIHLAKANNSIELWQSILDRNAGNISNIFKTYRQKNRFSYTHPDFPGIRIDITSLKTSKIPVKRFLDSKLIENPKEYEIEIEWTDTNYPLDKYIEFLQTFGTKLLTLKHNFPVLTSKTDREIGFKLYKSAIKLLRNQIIEEKINIVNDVKTFRETADPDIKKKYQNKPFSMFHKFIERNKDIDKAVSNYNFLKQDFDRLQDRKLFISPKPISLSLNHVREENPNSILFDYTVTDKADGENMILFTTNIYQLPLSKSDKEALMDFHNRLFLINSNLIVYDTGIRFPKDAEIPLIIANGEYINMNTTQHSYFMFDIYYYENEVLVNLPLMTKNPSDRTRYLQMIMSKDFLKSKFSEDNKFKLDVKKFSMDVIEFKLTYTSQDIFYQSNVIWQSRELKPYRLDGLIYTPALLPAGYKDDELDYELNMHLTWDKSLKWKPPEDNTIDFLVRFKKDTIISLGDKKLEKPKIISKLDISESGTFLKQFIVAELYNGTREGSEEPPCNIQKKSIELIEEKPSLINRPVRFTPKFPSDPEAYEILIPLPAEAIGKSNILPIDKNGQVIEDDTIIECAYEGWNSEEPGYKESKGERWKVLRTRYEKTFEYKTGMTEKFKLFKQLSEINSDIRSGRISIDSANKFQVDKIRRLMPLIRKLGDMPKFIYGNSELQYFIENIENINNKIRNPEDIPIDLRYGNDMMVARDIWEHIHNPVSEEMITTGRNIPDKSEEEEKYYARDISIQRDKSITLPMQNFIIDLLNLIFY